MRVSSIQHQQDAGENTQSDYAVREGEAVPLIHELARQVAVARQD